MQRTLLVLPALSFGGAERIALNLLRGLDRDKVWLLGQSALSGPFEAFSDQWHSFDQEGCLDPYDYSLSNGLRYGAAIARVARRLKAESILAFMHNGSYFLALARLCHGWKGQCIGSIHGNLSAYFAHRGHPPSIQERLLIVLALWGCHRMIVPSKGVADDLLAQYGGRPRRIQVIPNGIDLETIRRRALEIPESPGVQALDRPLVLSASRLSPQKDFGTLFEAFSAIRDQTNAVLGLVGSGELESELRAEVAARGLESRILFFGFQENPYAYMARSTVLVLSSFYEGAPVSILEGLALGLPQVVSDCPSGPAELLEEGRSGFLVGVGDHQAMGQRLLMLLGDPDLRRAMKAAALERAETFSLERMLRVYRTVLDPQAEVHSQ